MSRILQSEYMHWAKNQAPVRYGLSSSEVPHVSLDAYIPDIAALELDGASRHRYPPLREAIACHNGVAPENVVMADGTSMANMLAMAALIEPGDDVLVETPGYEPMIATAAFLGGHIRRFERAAPDFALDPQAVADAMTPATRLVVVTNLHNPSGALADAETLTRVAEIATEAGARLLVDEVYRFAATTPQPTAASLARNIVATASLTKCYGLSGMRCGWILAAPDLAERMWRLNELYGVAQAHAAEQLSLIAFDNIEAIAAGNAERLAVNRARVRAFIDARDDIEAGLIEHGITCFPRLLEGDVDRLDSLLRSRHDGAIVPGRFFGSPDHFRIGYGMATDRLDAGLDRLGAALDELGDA